MSRWVKLFILLDIVISLAKDALQFIRVSLNAQDDKKIDGYCLVSYTLVGRTELYIHKIGSYSRTVRYLHIISPYT